MKRLITIFIALLPFFVEAQTTYHVASDGSGDFTTIAQVNTATFSAGDQILFKRGDTFTGQIITKNDGVTYDAYGSGNKPVITSLVAVTAWTNLGSNIWESTNRVSSLTALNIVLFNGKNTPAGQYPNSFATYQSHSGNNSITSSSINSAITNWTGANVFIRLNDFEQVKAKITAHSGSTLTTDNTNANTPTDGYGFFITDDPRTLDVQNEWYYNPSTGKIRVYSSSMPTNVSVPTKTSLFYSNNENITLQNIDFDGAADTAIQLITCPGILVQNINVNHAGKTGIYLDYTDNGIIQNNTIKNCNDIGIRASGANTTVNGNTIDSIGILWNPNGCGIIISADYHTVQYNNITNVGRYGIQDAWGYGSIQYNYINTFCLNANDAGAIYLNGSRSGSRLVDHNIIINGIGNLDGTTDSYAIHGIYLDAHPTFIVVTNNTVTGVPQGGIKVHMAADCRVENNTVYDCGRNLSMEDYEGNYIRRDTIRNNLFFAKVPDQLALYWYTVNDDISLSGIFDNNIYVNPVNTSQVIETREPTAGYNFRTIASWQSFRESTASTLTDWTDTSKILLVYNNSGSSTSKSITGTFKNATGTTFTSSVTLAPFEGELLYQTASAVAAPTISMSGDQNITVDHASIYATATWASGRGGSYSWTKISGPGTTTISTPTNSSTDVLGLQTGTYVFRCTILQDDGQTAYGEVAVTVAIPTESLSPNAYIKFRVPHKFINN